MGNKIKLDAYEKDIEENFEKLPSVGNKKNTIKMLQSATKKQLNDKKPIRTRMAVMEIFS